MNNEERNEERMAGLLVEVASRLSPRGGWKQLVERTLARGTDRIFSYDSPLGEVYVGVSEKGVRLVGRATSAEEFSRLSVPRYAYHRDLLPCHLCQRQEDRVRESPALPLGQGSGQCRLQALQGLPSGGGRVTGANDATDAGSK